MNRGLIGAVAAIVVAVIIAAGSWYTVDQTERGVLLRYGAVIGAAQPGLAEALRLNGEAKASNIRITGEAEASAIEARAKALGTNPNLVTLVQAERWNGVLPTTMVPGSAVPFVSVK